VNNNLQLPPFRLIHAAYVTSDLASGKRRLTELYGVTKFREYSDIPIAAPGGGLRIDFAIANANGTHLEVIQPLEDKPNVYTYALPADPTHIAFHHYASRINDKAEWDGLMKTIDDHGLDAPVRGGNDDHKNVYVDTRSHLGHILEFIWLADLNSAIGQEILHPLGR
jgi:hypothetical protein